MFSGWVLPSWSDGRDEQLVEGVHRDQLLPKLRGPTEEMPGARRVATLHEQSSRLAHHGGCAGATCRLAGTSGCFD